MLLMTETRSGEAGINANIKFARDGKVSAAFTVTTTTRASDPPTNTLIDHPCPSAV